MDTKKVEDILLNAGLYAQYDIADNGDVLVYGYIFIGKVSSVECMTPDDVNDILSRYFGEPVNPIRGENNDQ